MFVIYGLNKEDINYYGGVEVNYCNNCKENSEWELNKISHYFTLFFIHLFPHSNYYWLHCPICKVGLKLYKKDAKDYVEISKIKLQYLKKEISCNQYEIEINKIQNIISEKRKIKCLKYRKKVMNGKSWLSQKQMKN